MLYVTLSMTLLAIGVYGLVTRHDLMKVLISIEIIASAVTMNLILFSSLMQDAMGEAFMVLVLSVDASITAIALSFAIVVYRRLKTLDVRELSRLRE